MRVLAAFDKFKDSIPAPQACAIAAGVIRGLGAGWSCDPCPLSDGGDGFAAVLTEAAEGSARRIELTGPRGRLTAAWFGIAQAGAIPPAALRRLGLVGGRVAILEMASASGLALLSPAERDPRLATSTGTGELIRAAASAGAEAILIGVGGSATHDLGLGALAALGLRFLDAEGRVVDPPVPANWPRIRSIASDHRPLLPPLFIACDVDNPLLGPRGAARVFGPQKGLRAVDLGVLEKESERLALLLCEALGKPAELMHQPGAGAAGGIAFGLMAATGARLVPGFELVSDWLGLEARIAAADVVLTGEGRFDDTSLGGKGPGAVALQSLRRGKQVHVLAGQVQISRSIEGLSTHAITPEGMPLADALGRAPALLEAAVRKIFTAH